MDTIIVSGQQTLMKTQVPRMIHEWSTLKQRDTASNLLTSINMRPTDNCIATSRRRRCGQSTVALFTGRWFTLLNAISSCRHRHGLSNS